MTREEWQRIKKLSADALELPAPERAAYVARACSGDESLAREVLSIVANADAAAGLFESPEIRRTTLSGGNRIGPYEIDALIGSGGMGEVYRARDVRLGRDVAVKVLPLVLSIDHDRVRRFEDEARAAGILNHPNILTVFDVGSHDGISYLVTELLEGQTLRQRLTESLPLGAAVDYACQIADGLAAAHRKGIVHRDLKPDNLFITVDDRVKILDFGLAKLASEGPIGRDDTAPGMVMGSVGYMAPEQVRSEAVDARTDIFALGAVLYEMLAGRRAFAGPSPAETMHAVVNSEPEPLKAIRPEVTAALAEAIATALRKAPEERFQTAADFARVLRSAVAAPIALTGPSRRRWRPGRTAFATAAALAVLGLAAAVAWRLRAPVNGDGIIVGEIVNGTGDVVFDGTLRQALLFQLEPSPSLRVVGDSRLRQALQMMERPAAERLTPEVALEVCRREGEKATVTGSLAALGERYVIHLNAADCLSGDPFAREEEHAERKEEVVEALARAVVRLRGRLGESLGEIERFPAPAERATTSSLEALKSLSDAMAARARGSEAEAIALLHRAVELDPDFAFAHIRLSSIYSTAGEFELSARHAARAYEHKELTGERERLVIEHGYYKRVTGQLDLAIAALQRYRQTYPRDFDPPLNLSAIYAQQGNYEDAVREAFAAMRLTAPLSQASAALARAQLGLNQFDRLRRAAKSVPESALGVYHRILLHDLSFIDGDRLTMQKQVDWAAGTLGEAYLRVQHAHALAAEGRFGASRSQFRDTIAAAERFGLREVAATVEAYHAIAEAAVGHHDEARVLARSSVDRGFGRQASSLAAVALAMAGSPADAGDLADRIAKAYPLDTLVNEVLLPSARAGIAERPAEGIEILRRASPYELGWTSYYLPIYLRGVIYLQQHDGRSARAEFQRIIDHQGVMPVSPLYVLARLQLGRAAVLEGDTAAARRAYEQFLSAWKDADPDIALLQLARAEHARLAP
jgi:hypothetical protein